MMNIKSVNQKSIKSIALIRGIFMLMIVVLSFIGCDNGTRFDKKLSYDDYISMAQKYLQEGDTDKAIAAYKNAVTVNPSAAETHYILGEIYYREWANSLETSQRGQLFDLFTNPQKSQPKDNTKELSKFGLKAEYEDLAIGEFKEAVKYNPENWKARLYIAGSYMKKKQYQEAIVEYKKTIELNPEYIPVYGSIGRAYLKAGSIEQAIDSLNKAIQLDPSNSYDYYSLGLAYRRINNSDKVNEILRKLKDMKSVYYDELRLRIFGAGVDD